jgi:LuxR family maltose regulon positive regulatory protein
MVASTPVLATKLHIPPPPPKLVARSRLTEQLDAGLIRGCKLTLISAPAGFGKSTLVSAWIAKSKRRASWLSLDENDNNLLRFLIYLINALQTISPNLGAGLLDLLRSSQSSPIESIFAELLNELAAVPENFILVLDDYHLTDARPIDEALTFMVEHLPAQMHLVITTREDPALPIPRLRVRN